MADDGDHSHSKTVEVVTYISVIAHVEHTIYAHKCTVAEYMPADNAAE